MLLEQGLLISLIFLKVSIQKILIPSLKTNQILSGLGFFKYILRYRLYNLYHYHTNGT